MSEHWRVERGEMPTAETVLIPRAGLEPARIGHTLTVVAGPQKRCGTIVDMVVDDRIGLCLVVRLDA
jgi:hypothetical protein